MIFLFQLSSLLREVKYLTLLEVDSVPESANTLYAQNDTLWKYRAGLKITTAMYNEVLHNISYFNITRTYSLCFMSMPGLAEGQK